MTNTLTITPTFTTAFTAQWGSAGQTVVNQVISDLQTAIVPTQNAVFAITYDWTASGVGASTIWGTFAHSYTSMRNSLIAIPNLSPIQTLAYNTTNLPTSSIFPGVFNTDYAIFSGVAYTDIIGLSNSGIGSAVTTVQGSAYDTSDPHGANTPTPNTSTDMYQVIFHETTEPLCGRAASCGQAGQGVTHQYQPGDMFSYSSAATRNFVNSGTRFISDDGSNVYCNLNNNPGGDFGDTTENADSFNAFVDAITGVSTCRSATLPGQSWDWKYINLCGMPLSDTGGIWAGFAPINTINPVASGAGAIGQTLSTTNGTWSYATGSYTTYTYQWQRNGSNIGGATNSTYTTQGADGNTSVRCVVTANNGNSSVSANSNAISVAGGVGFSFSAGLRR